MTKVTSKENGQVPHVPERQGVVRKRRTPASSYVPTLFPDHPFYDFLQATKKEIARERQNNDWKAKLAEVDSLVVQGFTNKEAAARLGVSKNTVYDWRKKQRAEENSGELTL